MSMYQSIGTASDNVADCVVATLVSGLEVEFGRGAGQALAHRFLEAEEADFRWDARVAERWICAYEGADDEEDLGLDRNTICGRLNGTWFCATMFVDGDSEAHAMMGCRTFRSLAGRAMRCSMRTDRGGNRGEGRRRKAIVSPLFLSLGDEWEGGKGKQDKGSVSRPCVSLCLHILLSRDKHSRPRDSGSRNGENQPLSARNHETGAPCDV